MTDEYLTPSGKFEIVLFGHSFFDEESKKVVKQFQTNEDAMFKGVKSPIGMFENLYIKNDLGAVKSAIDNYYN